MFTISNVCPNAPNQWYIINSKYTRTLTGDSHQSAHWIFHLKIDNSFAYDEKLENPLKRILENVDSFMRLQLLCPI